MENKIYFSATNFWFYDQREWTIRYVEKGSKGSSYIAHSSSLDGMIEKIHTQFTD